MRNYTCPRCSSAFYSAVTGPSNKCPFCGFVLKQSGIEARLERRRSFRRNCRIVKGDSDIAAETVDISRKGAGVVIKGPAPIKRDDAVRLGIEDFDIKSNARVVWVQQSGEGGRRAGLKFF